MGLPPFHTKKVGLIMVVDIVVHVVRGGKGVMRQASCAKGESARLAHLGLEYVMRDS